MNADAARFDNPKFARDRACGNEREEVSQTATQESQRARPGEIENDDTGASFGREPRYVAEVAIKRNERSALRNAGLEHHGVGGPAKPLLQDAHHVMAVLPQEFDTASADVLIDLDIHSAGSTGTGMIRSRDASAP